MVAIHELYITPRVIDASDPKYATQEFPVTVNAVQERVAAAGRRFQNINKDPIASIHFGMSYPIELLVLIENERVCIDNNPNIFTGVFDADNNKKLRKFNPGRCTTGCNNQVPQGFDNTTFTSNQRVVAMHLPRRGTVIGLNHLVVVEEYDYDHREDVRTGYIVKAYPSESIIQKHSGHETLTAYAKIASDTIVDQIRLEGQQNHMGRFEVSPAKVVNKFLGMFRNPDVLKSLKSKISLPELFGVALNSINDRIDIPVTAQKSIHRYFQGKRDAQGYLETRKYYTNPDSHTIIYVTDPNTFSMVVWQKENLV